jgi:hypothetical protein
MKANELRIGNWVRHPNSEWDEQLDIENFNVENIEYYTPIPLTEEWLIKFGFEKQDFLMSGCEVYQKGYWRIAKKVKPHKEEYWSLWHKQVSPPTWNLSTFDYVHQLQNLYFALTGEELKP